jgi:transcription antitermination protein NusB
MISRRQIRIKVMQAIYAWYCTNEEPTQTFDMNLKDFADEIRDFERRKGDKGDSRLLMELFYDTIKHCEEYDQLIQSKAENWELERIALIDRILMQMGISEMTHFEEIPIKVTINEYLEIAKKFSTPKSSKFINGILDSLYIQFKKTDQIQKSGRGLIEESIPKRRPGGFGQGGGYNQGGQGGGYNQGGQGGGYDRGGQGGGYNQGGQGGGYDRGGQGGGYNQGGQGGGYDRGGQGGGYERGPGYQGPPREQDGPPKNYEDRRLPSTQRPPTNPEKPANSQPGTEPNAQIPFDDKKKRPRIRKNENDNT